ncbi:MAG: hypothetical protein QM757_16225 [Paludibaculum sp.]
MTLIFSPGGRRLAKQFDLSMDASTTFTVLVPVWRLISMSTAGLPW